MWRGAGGTTGINMVLLICAVIGFVATKIKAISGSCSYYYDTPEVARGHKIILCIPSPAVIDVEALRKVKGYF